MLSEFGKILLSWNTQIFIKIVQKCNIFLFLDSAYKTCTIQGEWWRHPETNMTWSNYTKCVDVQDLEVSPILQSTYALGIKHFLIRRKPSANSGSYFSSSSSSFFLLSSS